MMSWAGGGRPALHCPSQSCYHCSTQYVQQWENSTHPLLPSLTEISNLTMFSWTRISDLSSWTLVPAALPGSVSAPWARRSICRTLLRRGAPSATDLLNCSKLTPTVILMRKLTSGWDYHQNISWSTSLYVWFSRWGVCCTQWCITSLRMIQCSREETV